MKYDNRQLTSAREAKINYKPIKPSDALPLLNQTPYAIKAFFSCHDGMTRSKSYIYLKGGANHSDQFTLDGHYIRTKQSENLRLFDLERSSTDKWRCTIKCVIREPERRNPPMAFLCTDLDGKGFEESWCFQLEFDNFVKFDDCNYFSHLDHHTLLFKCRPGLVPNTTTFIAMHAPVTTETRFEEVKNFNDINRYGKMGYQDRRLLDERARDEIIKTVKAHNAHRRRLEIEKKSPLRVVAFQHSGLGK
jgi:hypothetical protein